MVIFHCYVSSPEGMSLVGSIGNSLAVRISIGRTWPWGMAATNSCCSKVPWSYPPHHVAWFADPLRRRKGTQTWQTDLVWTVKSCEMKKWPKLLGKKLPAKSQLWQVMGTIRVAWRLLTLFARQGFEFCIQECGWTKLKLYLGHLEMMGKPSSNKLGNTFVHLCWWAY